MTRHLQKLKKFDKQPYEFTLNFQGVQAYQSGIGGLCSLMFFIIALTLLTFKLIDLFQHNHVYYNTNVLKGDDKQMLDISSGNFYIKMYVDSVSNTKANSQRRTSSPSLLTQDKLDQQLVSLGFDPVTFSQLPKYGVQAIFQNYTIRYENNKSVLNRTDHNLVQCKQSQYKVCLPQNQSYYLRGNSNFEVNQKQSQILDKKQVYRRICIILRKCKPSTNQKCQPFQNQMKFIFYFNNNQLNASAVQEEETIVKQDTRRTFQSHTYIDGKEVVMLNVFFKRVIMRTDSSILPQFAHSPQYSNFSSWFYDEQLMNQNQPFDNNTNNLLVIYLKRSVQTVIFTRHYQKLDFMLGAFFGEISFIAIIMFGVYKGYNRWAFQQFVSKKIGIKYQQPNLYAFYKLKIKNILYKLSCKKCYKQFIQQQVRIQNQLRELFDFKNVIMRNNLKSVSCQYSQNFDLEQGNVLNQQEDDNVELSYEIQNNIQGQNFNQIKLEQKLLNNSK